MHRPAHNPEELQQYCSAQWLHGFESKPRSKGIVYHSERTAQLQQVVAIESEPEKHGANPFSKFVNVETKASVRVAINEDEVVLKRERGIAVANVALDTSAKSEVTYDAAVVEDNRITKKRRRVK